VVIFKHRQPKFEQLHGQPWPFHAGMKTAAATISPKNIRWNPFSTGLYSINDAGCDFVDTFFPTRSI
jgi:hypothetical protein